jgi:hypothetical protein
LPVRALSVRRSTSFAASCGPSGEKLSKIVVIVKDSEMKRVL